MSRGYSRQLVAVALWSCLQMGCGGDGREGPGSTSAGDGGNPGGFVTRMYQLVETANPDIRVTEALDVFMYDANTGVELDPPVRATSKAGAGTFELTYPSDVRWAIYIVGAGTDEMAHYDSIVIEQPGAPFDPRLRMSVVSTAQLVFDVAEIEPRQDGASLAGTVYWSPNGERQGVIGCAQVLLDDDTTGLDVASDQRYVGDNVLPVPADKQAQTDPVQGSFYFGSISKGRHRMRAVLDGGATVLGEIDVPIAYVRENAIGPSGLVFYTTAFDIDVPENPTPPGCSIEP